MGEAGTKVGLGAARESRHTGSNASKGDDP